jgi:hypothetical protein
MQSGYLASQCGFDHLELRVCQSAAGYYVGTWCPEEGPVSRESREYYLTQAEAQAALDQNTFTQRLHP